ncbi:DUF2073 domain-containing protein [archaeon]|jgi:hypothetical protein|nr:DUF2073 domain-containing protein [archaeon]MBT6824407.1 DUF2073 domain-containing protein [archaeon]MBT7107314.1 DUF2073 domain-containing protein [archaeon]MBT7297383.1 DUF2073 domain-containing protein [archaeon]
MITFQYIPYREHSGLETEAKLNRIIDVVMDERIVLLEGRLRPDEEAQLIEKTMEVITKKFKGISFCTINPNQTQRKNGKKKEDPFSTKLKDGFYKILMGRREGLTIIGPATIIKEIRKDPSKIELLTKAPRRRRKK